MNKAFQLLYQLFSQRQNIVALLDKTLLIETESDIQAYNDFIEVARKLAVIFEKSEEWLFKGTDNKSALTLAEQAREHLAVLEVKIFEFKNNTQQALINNFVSRVQQSPSQ